MPTIRMTRVDGTTYEAEHNDDVWCQGVDAEGNYLGHIALSQAAAAVFAPPTDGTYRWDFDAKSWNRVFTLDELKALKWEEMKARRDAIEFSTFEWDGSIFDADSVSTSRIMGAFSLAMAALSNAQPFDMEWTLADNSKRTLTGMEMIGVGIALGTFVATAHAQASAIRAAIEAATNQAELEAVQWPT